ncbi:MAG: NAD-dependent deacylase [Deltaproteobacteria bacterium]|nr:NAD-dependent deacylase [Deltaproteobacteria bacterium]
MNQAGSDPTPFDPALLARPRDALRAARKVVVLTGAGVSAESGVPTFRGEGGLWRDREVTSLATPEGFAQDPELVWEFYNWRRELLSRCQPNPAHLALAALERIRPGLVLITQNIDGLHAAAGSENIVELHGNLWRLRCLGCGQESMDFRVPVPYPPLCPCCRQMLRPGVVWFGEALDAKTLDRASRASQECEAMLVVGTSAVVYPAASLAPLAKEQGAVIIEVNIEATSYSSLTDFSLLGPAGVILPALIEGLEAE